jgi:hypothetical protein
VVLAVSVLLGWWHHQRPAQLHAEADVSLAICSGCSPSNIGVFTS